mgnify:CR=1 FL=1
MNLKKNQGSKEEHKSKHEWESKEKTKAEDHIRTWADSDEIQSESVHSTDLDKTTQTPYIPDN